MPYITSATKDDLESYSYTGGPPPTGANAGQLNYLVTMVIKNYLEEHKLSYQTINDIMGALEGAKLEFVRRVVNPYETQKCHDNGDVYT